MNQIKNKAKEYWHMLGPGLTTGAADDDPSGIATYSQAGAGFGFGMLWTAALTFPFMAIVQEMCARIGIVTGRGLAGAIGRHYPRWVIFICATLLLVANTFNIGADLGIMARATQLLLPGLGSVVLLIFFTLFSLYLEVFTSYKKYAHYLKWIALILLSYAVAAFAAHLDWGEVLKNTFVPQVQFNKDWLLIFTAILGTTISPYLFFWQTSQEVEEQIMEGKKTIKQREAITTPQDLKKMRVDIWSGMFLSNLVMFFIIAVCAGTLFKEGLTQINDATEAAKALRPFAGSLSYFLFTLGIIGTGLLALPILAGSSSYALSEAFGWREGLYRKFKQAHAFYGVIIVSMLVGLLMNFLHLNVIKMLIYSAVLNGLVAPFILAVIVILSADKKIMKQFASKPLTVFLGWVITIVMAVAAVLTVISL